MPKEVYIFLLLILVFIVSVYFLIKELRLRRDYKNYLKRKAARDAIAENIDDFKWRGLEHDHEITADQIREALELKRKTPESEY